MLGLKRTPEQDAALATLLREQQDPTSANYHKWITPQEFGARFGPSDHDVQAVTSWLQSHGFQSVEVSPSRTVIHFSGTAAQVHDAFRTAIHRYVVNKRGTLGQLDRTADSRRARAMSSPVSALCTISLRSAPAIPAAPSPEPRTEK